MPTLDIRQPDDWHVHFRDGDVLTHTVNASARQFGRVLAMPNLQPALENCGQTLAYLARIQAVLHTQHADFTAYGTLYLTAQTSVQDVASIKNTAHQRILGIKWYPAGATTNSHQGIADIFTKKDVLAAMQTHGIPLLVHGEVVRDKVDIFDREAYFIDEVLIPLRRDFPELKISFEHISTQQAVDFVTSQASPYLGASITPQHLLFDRNQLLLGGLRPHYYCLPILKRAEHKRALQQAAIRGLPYFYAGTDSAPHAIHAKQSACGCAGCYSAPHAIELYAQFFDEHQALPKLEDFTSRYGAEFYGLPLNTKRIKLIKQAWQIPDTLQFYEGYDIVPLAAGQTLNWIFV